MTMQTEIRRIPIVRKMVRTWIDFDRTKFNLYCLRTVSQARTRAQVAGVPFEIDVHVLDEMFVDQGWRCSVSGIPFTTPGRGTDSTYHREPFGPSLDRIIPERGYVPGNIRLVCTIVNTAMNEWGLETLLMLFDAVAAQRARPSEAKRDLVQRIIRQGGQRPAPPTIGDRD